MSWPNAFFTTITFALLAGLGITGLVVLWHAGPTAWAGATTFVGIVGMVKYGADYMERRK